jgi:hypothetical protein
MHSCLLCGKTMATAGGLEVHMELSHPPEHPEPEPSPLELEVVAATQPVFAARRAREWRLPFRGVDSTIPLTGLMVMIMLVGGIGAAVHRATAHPVFSTVSGLSTTGTPPTTAPFTAIGENQPSDTTPGGATSPPVTEPAISAPAAQPSADAVAANDPSACQPVVAGLSTRASRRTADLAALMGSGTLAPLPIPGAEHADTVDLTRYDTIQQFLDGQSVVDPAVWQAKMEADGFRTAEVTGFQFGRDVYGALALRFASFAQASDFNRATLSSLCAAGGMARAKPIPGLSGGLMYILMLPDSPPFRASFVAGDTVVRLNICKCVEALDQQALVGQWAQAVAAQVGAA